MEADRSAAHTASRDEAENYLEWFRHSANPKTLAEANVIANELATLLEEAWEFDAMPNELSAATTQARKLTDA